MSILTAIKSKLPSSKELQRQIELHGTALREAEAECGTVAASSPLSEEHQRAARKLADAEHHWVLLNQAHEAAKTREAAELEANREKIRESQRLAALGHCRHLLKDAEALAAALAQSVSLYQALLEHLKKIYAAKPIGAQVPDAVLAPGRIRQLVVAELFKLSAPAAGSSIGRDRLKLFPGASSPDIHYEDQAEKIPAFVTQIEAEIAAFKTAISKKAE